MMNNFSKRVFDLSVAIPFLVVLSPVFFITALAVRITSPGPIFFTQERGGLNGNSFNAYKFRSMYINNEDPNSPREIDGGHPLVTPVGRVIRRLKIDELPQLWNVIRGEMSIVGPRPTLMQQIEKYSDKQRRRLEVLPGLTGWAQVNGNIKLSWDERISLDLWYIDNYSFLLDIKIIWMTFSVIFFGEHSNREALDAAGIRRRGRK